MNDKMVDDCVPVSSILTRSTLFKYALHLMLLAFVSNELGPIDQRLEFRLLLNFTIQRLRACLMFFDRSHSLLSLLFY